MTEEQMDVYAIEEERDLLLEFIKSMEQTKEWELFKAGIKKDGDKNR